MTAASPPVVAVPALGARALAVLVATAAATAGLLLAAHHPLSAPVAMLGFTLAAITFHQWRWSWLVGVPALLPLAALAPWSGWLAFEEWDLLVLAAAAGGYSRALRGGPLPAAWPRLAAVAWLVLAAFTASQAAAAWRGVTDAGGFVFGWFQGYREPMNSLRMAKPLAAAWLLLPLWAALDAQDAARTRSRIVLGMVLGLGGAAVAATAERLAYTGLTNFSTDYRTTALFWEMHVGGAALDGFLALTVPFAVHALLQARGAGRAAALAGVLLLAAYAALTTFSRIVYAALPAGLMVLMWVRWRQHRADRTLPRWHWLRGAAFGAAFVAAFVWSAAQVFPRSGYRGMLALFGIAVVLMLLPAAARGAAGRWRVAGLAAGLAVAALGAWVAAAAAKGAYVAYTAAALVVLAGLLARRAAPAAASGWAGAAAVAGYVGMLATAALVVRYRGGTTADAAWALLPWAAALWPACFVARAPWPQQPRWQGTTAGSMVVAAAVVATFGGGAYMGERFTTAGSDFVQRIAHWRSGLALLQSPTDLWFGRGLGRFVDDHAFHAPAHDQPGDIRLRHDPDGAAFVVLAAGTHVMGWGEMLRLSQRIALPQGRATVALEARTDKPALLHLDLCEKHLLYVNRCHITRARLPGQPGAWQAVQLAFGNETLSPGRWYAPKWIVFSLAAETPGQRIDVRRVTLTDETGRPLLANGAFEADLARWFFTSDRHHLPWHIKNIGVHAVYEQGLVGAALLAALVAGALLRLAAGSARANELAPPLAGALAGFLVVGQFDSLLDVPRVAFLFYWSVLLALASRGYTPAAAHRVPTSP